MYMKSRYRISDSEQEIMEELWLQEEPIKQSELLEHMNQKGKHWQRQTMNTLLARLEDKQLVQRDRRMVKALVSCEEYKLLQMEEAIDTLYNGRLGSFVMALTKHRTISKEDAEVLRSMIEKLDQEEKA